MKETMYAERPQKTTARRLEQRILCDVRFPMTWRSSQDASESRDRQSASEECLELRKRRCLQSDGSAVPNGCARLDDSDSIFDGKG